MTEADAARLNLIRSEVLRNRYNRQGIAQPKAAIFRTLAIDHPDATAEEVGRAVDFLHDERLLDDERATFGPAINYRINAAGIRHAEDNGIV